MNTYGEIQTATVFLSFTELKKFNLGEKAKAYTTRQSNSQIELKIFPNNIIDEDTVEHRFLDDYTSYDYFLIIQNANNKITFADKL